MSTSDGKVLADLPIGESVDAVKADRGQAFATYRDGMAVASETSTGKFEIVQTVKTSYGSRTMGLDEGLHKIYLPAAEMEATKPKPGTFHLLVVARKANN
jgi:hypothetical protein